MAHLRGGVFEVMERAVKTGRAVPGDDVVDRILGDPRRVGGLRVRRECAARLGKADDDMPAAVIRHRDGRLGEERLVLVEGDIEPGLVLRAQVFPRLVDERVEVVNGGHGSRIESNCGGASLAPARGTQTWVVRACGPPTRHASAPGGVAGEAGEQPGAGRDAVSAGPHRRRARHGCP